MSGVDFTVLGTPSTQGNKTGYVRGGRVVLVEGRRPEARANFASWRDGVANEARRWVEANGPDGYPIDGPVIVTLTFRLQRPASAPKRRRTWPTGKGSGDISKLARAVEDAVTGILLTDDARIVGEAITKDYGRPGVRVQLWPLVDPDENWIPEWTLAVAPAVQETGA